MDNIDKVQLFDSQFWPKYPRKVSRKSALKAFLKIDLTQDLMTKIIESVDKQAKSPKWQEKGGEYIPHAATWLNGERWEDTVGDLHPTTSYKLTEVASKEPENRPWQTLTDEQIVDTLQKNPIQLTRGFTMISGMMKSSNPELYGRVRKLVIELVGADRAKKIAQEALRDQQSMSLALK
jgi:hypothetical protein